MGYYFLTYKDIEPCLERLTNGKTISKVIEVKNEKDINELVGLIIKAIQDWELEVKKLLDSLKVDNGNIVIKGIGDIIAHLNNRKIFNDEEGYTLRDVVKLRNYITHHFYLEYTHANFYSLRKADEVLNKIYFVIKEAKVMVRNKSK